LRRARAASRSRTPTAFGPSGTRAPLGADSRRPALLRRGRAAGRRTAVSLAPAAARGRRRGPGRPGHRGRPARGRGAALRSPTDVNGGTAGSDAAFRLMRSPRSTPWAPDLVLPATSPVMPAYSVISIITNDQPRLVGDRRRKTRR